ncbi:MULTISPECIES: DnaB-like helicase C-terminal domain-containing protein [unclassified Simplicispira]|uniref:replicative DNA helicase n=1 Tax=unclassified Simplicispira TaxID=2630407 RepID=UPI000D5E2F52|nr:MULTISPECIES: DnaB-like helicase C-terminal domain-containing protein [unclassified Simplicispira]PVY56754.1 replicative DNA helicase [Simplicispira sp. 125]REG17699.1 replicative DNA helicase [Simplicispira sp. 110]
MKSDSPEILATPGHFCNEHIEAAALSILINFPAAFDDVSDRLRPEHFAVEAHRVIYAELCRQMAAGNGCDVMSIVDALIGVLEVSDVLQVASCNNHSARGISRHVQTLVDAFKARQLHGLSYKMAELAYETGPVQERIDRAQAELAKLDDVEQSDDWIDAHTAAIKHLDLLDQRQEGKLKGMPTGLHDFDEMLDGGLSRGNLVVIGARPAMGKTALAMTIGLYMAQAQSVGFLSMEMPHSDVRDRQAAILSRASIGMIKRPQKGLEYDRIVDGVEKAKTLRWFVSDKSGLNIMQVRSRARALKRRHGLDILVVDYIGLMSGMDSKQPRAYQIEEISRGLKGLAKDLDITVICLAQVNRGGVERVGQVPGLQDLRDSGAIEQDADVVAFIHRPIEAQPELGENFRNYALLRVAKNRQGRTGDVNLFYHGQFTSFESWAGPPPQKGVGAQSKGFE